MRKLSLLACATVLLPSGALARGQQEGAAQTAHAEKTQGAEKAQTAKPEQKDKDIDETVKGFDKMEGVFTLYRQKKGASDQVLMEISADQLGPNYMLQATAATGTVNTPVTIFHGQPLGDVVFHVKKTDEDRILFMSPDLSQRADYDPETKKTVERIVPEDVMATFDIKAKQASRKSVLIDVTDFLKSSQAGVDGSIARAGQGYAVDRANTVIHEVKTYPENFIARTEFRLNYHGPLPTDAKSIPFGVSYNIMSLPDDGYKPRLGDPRVGFFTSSFQDISNPEKQNWNVNYILRWNLKKKDPSAAMSEPEKPIVWWIDNAMPKKYREAVREGVLMWNKAFEQIGIKDALQVKQMPDDADWDIADVRYNVIRWTVDMPFAIALFRANPINGEIVNAAVNFDAAFANGGARQFELVLGPGNGEPALPPGLEQYKDRICMAGEEGLQSLSFGEIANDILGEGMTGYSSDAVVQQYIREVAGHEVGHCLGLRHNFTASTNLSVSDLGNPDDVSQQGVSASLMEYTPYNIFSIKHPGVDFYSRTIGPYDMWAIKYGYMNIDASTPQGEKGELLQVASQTNQPGHQFMTDELANNFDPYVATFDLGKNPLDWTEKVMNTSRYLLMNLGDRKPASGQSYFQFTRDFTSLANTYGQGVMNAERFIGGERTSQNYKGDPGEKPTVVPVDAATQKRALDQVLNYGLGPNAFEFPKSYYAKLAGNPESPGNQPPPTQRQFPLFSQFSAMQGAFLDNLFFSDRLTRVENNEFKSNDTLTLAGLFRTTGDSLWSELESGKEISQLRRSIQREYLRIMIQNVMDRPAGMPNDAVTLSLEQLHSLKGRLQRALPYAKGEYGKPHIEECLSRIDKALNAPYIGDGH